MGCAGDITPRGQDLQGFHYMHNIFTELKITFLMQVNVMAYVNEDRSLEGTMQLPDDQNTVTAGRQCQLTNSAEFLPLDDMYKIFNQLTEIS